LKKVLITGGAGFIGSHLADLLISQGYGVRALDSLDPQVHGPDASRPAYLAGEIELVRGDVRDPAAVASALEGCSLLVHFAAAVGVGQSMYEISRYTSVNSLGAAVVLEAVSRRRDIEGMIVASSMSIYGEGLYTCPSCGSCEPGLRPRERMAAGLWEPLCPSCGAECSPAPTPESKTLRPTSVYAVNKRDHEELFLSVGDAYGIPATALRFFNVYGDRQALSNPYTGVAAIFASRLLNGNKPIVFEDGMQSRDFIHVGDVAAACLLALEKAPGGTFNIGTGRATPVMEIARMLDRILGTGRDPEVTGEFRAGDIRHCFADVSAAGRALGFKASVAIEDGMESLPGWLATQCATDLSDQAAGELRMRGLARR
jgi:dTDP-L-rhamnose 4-epimerase